MKKTIPLSLFAILCFTALPLLAQNADKIKAANGYIAIHPIHHATLALTYGNKTIFVDPTKGADAFNGLKEPDLILITDIHGDHFNIETLKALDTENAVFIVPKAVAERMPEQFKKQVVVLNNGETTSEMDITIHAVPMYNLPQSPDSYHPKDRGNGYVITLGGKRIYIAGDTEDTPEMRSLKNIDVAFIPMNLPYTMTVVQAADAVLDFEPSIVYPYHYSGSNIKKFKRLVNEGNADIEVRLRDWYPDK